MVLANDSDTTAKIIKKDFLNNKNLFANTVKDSISRKN